MNKIIFISGNEKGCVTSLIEKSVLRGQHLVVDIKSGNIQNLSTDKGYIDTEPFKTRHTSIENSGDEYVDALASLMDLIGDKTKVQIAYEKVYGEPLFKSLHETTNELAYVKEENAKLKKEIEYLKPRTWFADAVDNFCETLKQIGKEYAEEAKKLTAKEMPKKKLTKREKFWCDVKENINTYGGQWICVFPKDYDYFTKELEKELPTVTWGNGTKPSDNSWLSGFRYYIHLCNNGRMYFTDRPARDIKSEANKKVFTYRPPIDWEKFKKGDIC